jgi:hypothetical protein
MQELEEDPEMRAGLLLYKGTRASLASRGTVLACLLALDATCASDVCELTWVCPAQCPALLPSLAWTPTRRPRICPR